MFSHLLRWDTPQHVLNDDPGDEGHDVPDPIWNGNNLLNFILAQIFWLLAGKDYSNPRVSDFHTLTKPDEDMYDRTKVARMPWSATVPPAFLVAKLFQARCWPSSRRPAIPRSGSSLCRKVCRVSFIKRKSSWLVALDGTTSWESRFVILQYALIFSEQT